jgi:hypothetical protein
MENDLLFESSNKKAPIAFTTEAQLQLKAVKRLVHREILPDYLKILMPFSNVKASCKA